MHSFKKILYRSKILTLMLSIVSLFSISFSSFIAFEVKPIENQINVNSGSYFNSSDLIKEVQLTPFKYSSSGFSDGEGRIFQNCFSFIASFKLDATEKTLLNNFFFDNSLNFECKLSEQYVNANGEKFYLINENNFLENSFTCESAIMFDDSETSIGNVNIGSLVNSYSGNSCVSQFSISTFSESVSFILFNFSYSININGGQDFNEIYNQLINAKNLNLSFEVGLYEK